VPTDSTGDDVVGPTDGPPALLLLDPWQTCQSWRRAATERASHCWRADAFDRGAGRPRPTRPHRCLDDPVRAQLRDTRAPPPRLVYQALISWPSGRLGPTSTPVRSDTTGRRN